MLHMNIQRKELMIEKTGIIGGLDLREKAEHKKKNPHGLMVSLS